MISSLHAQRSSEQITPIFIAETISKDLDKLCKNKTFHVVYLIKTFEPQKESKENLDYVNSLLEEHNRNLDKNLKALQKRREEMGFPLDMEEYKKLRKESDARFRAVLTSTEQVSLESIFVKADSMRKEVLMIKDSRSLWEIRDALQKEPDSVKGMVTYYIHDGQFSSTSTMGGDNPLVPDAKSAVPASRILDNDWQKSLRKVAHLGIVNKSSVKKANFAEFGRGFLSPLFIKRFSEKYANLMSIEKQNDGTNEEIVFTIGDISNHGDSSKKSYSEYRLLPQKGYVISTFKAFIRGQLVSNMLFDSYVQIQDNLWFPQHVVMEARVKSGDDTDSFNQVEYLFVQPPSLKVDLDDAFFTINLTTQEKEEIDKNESIQITRRVIEIPEELRQRAIESDNDFRWRVVLMVIGVIFIFLAILFRRMGAKKDK